MVKVIGFADRCKIVTFERKRSKGWQQGCWPGQLVELLLMNWWRLWGDGLRGTIRSSGSNRLCSRCLLEGHLTFHESILGSLLPGGFWNPHLPFEEAFLNLMFFHIIPLIILIYSTILFILAHDYLTLSREQRTSKWMLIFFMLCILIALGSMNCRNNLFMPQNT